MLGLMVFVYDILKYLAKSRSLYQVKRIEQIPVLQVEDRLAGIQKRRDVLSAEKL